MIAANLSPDLDAIQARYDSAQVALSDGSSGVIRQLHRLSESANDVPTLLAMVREQRAKLDAVVDFIGWFDAASDPEEEFYAKGKVSARVTADRLRAAITATEGA